MTSVISYSQNKEIEKLKNDCYAISQKDFDKTIILANKGIEVALKEKDSVSYALFERILGSAYYFKGDYNNAVISYFKSIRVLENTTNKSELGSSYNELGKLYRKTKKLDLAAENYNKALKLFTELKDSVNISTINNESGAVYEYKNDYVEALKRYNLSLLISEKLNDSIAISYALNNISGIFSLQNKFSEAQNYLLKALEIRKQFKDSFALAINYTDLGSNSFSGGNYNVALKYLDSSNTIAKKINYLELQSQNYLIISKSYELLNNTNQAYINFKKHISLKDSIFTKESENHLNELNTKYQTEKKDLELAKNKADIKNEKNKRFITYGALAFFMALCSFIIWAFIQKRKAGKLLENKNKLLENANEEISHQKEELSEKQKEIVDSINYAKKIQTTLLASEDLLNGNLEGHFILFKPKDIVSGDFTWAAKKDNLFYFACCDSTGHGVPGAFMSLLNIGFLSEAIKERSILKPGEIFNYVRDRLIETIGKDEQQDGFDGIIICINSLGEITYAASNNSPLIIRNKECIQLTCNKMPVGKGVKTDSFDTFTMNYQKNDQLYLFTDGYADQFGGPKGKKFKYKPLQQLLVDYANEPLSVQKEKLEKAFEKWKGNLEQVDDVCIIGIKL